MAEYVYPAVFHHNADGSFTITFPDLPGCISEGKNLGNALYMAQSALTQWAEYMTDRKEKLPEASDVSSIEREGDEIVSLVRAEVRDGRAVKRTVSIPRWMDDMVSEHGLSLSKVLQDALRERLDIRY